MILAALAILIGSLTASWSENASNSFTERILRRFRSSAECQSASTFMKRTFDHVRLHPLLLANSVSWRVRPGAPRPCWCNGRRARQRRGRRDDGEGPARSAGPPHGSADAGGQRVRSGDRRDAGDLPVAGRAVWPVADRPTSEGARAEDNNRGQRCPDEMTLDGGKAMWTSKSWADYLPRLRRWMTIWEATVEQDLLSANQGDLGTIATATLWGAMTERLPQLLPLLREEAPSVVRLAEQARSQGALAAQAEESRKSFGNAWCGGEIEKSLRQVVQD